VALTKLANRVGDIGKGEMPRFLRHAAVKHDLKQQVTQFLAQRGHVVARDGVGDFVCLLNGIRRDRGEILRQIPFAPTDRIAQPRHDRQKTGQRIG
jgi:hypothetical protein